MRGTSARDAGDVLSVDRTTGDRPTASRWAFHVPVRSKGALDVPPFQARSDGPPLGLVPVLALSACGVERPDGAAAECNGLPEQPTISFAAYSTPREAYGKIISAFKTEWKEDHDDQEVIFQESYDGSTLQARRVVAATRPTSSRSRSVPTWTRSPTPD